MPRHARVLLPGVMYHIVQRGHNREPIFHREGDFKYYLASVRRFKKELDCQVYGYCLMTNHIHLIVQSGADPLSVSNFMKHVSGRQTRYVNRMYKRTGTLWESRFHSSPLESERYLLACCRYVEWNPVRAGMVVSPREYPWSSYHRHAYGKGSDWLDLDPWYLGLGGTPEERQRAYGRYFVETIPDNEWDMFRLATQQNKVAGEERFLKMIGKQVGWDASPHPRGRPKKDGGREK